MKDYEKRKLRRALKEAKKLGVYDLTSPIPIQVFYKEAMEDHQKRKICPNWLKEYDTKEYKFFFYIVGRPMLLGFDNEIGFYNFITFSNLTIKNTIDNSLVLFDTPYQHEGL